MSLLTDQEIHDADPAPHERFDQERIDFARAIEQAVIAKLAAGVNVEPVGYLNFIDRFGMEPFTTSPANESSKAVYHIYEMQIAIAAARVQALEDAAKRMEGPNNNYGAVIRALIGGKDV